MTQLWLWASLPPSSCACLCDEACLAAEGSVAGAGAVAGGKEKGGEGVQELGQRQEVGV